MNDSGSKLAWFEKYRPKELHELIIPPITIDGVKISEDQVHEIIKSFIDNKRVNGNILSYGPAGYGKSSLNELLVSKIITHPRDLFILDRKVESVDKLKAWLQQKPIGTQKIVKIEEIDRLSPQAQVTLKDGLMEKFQANASFLATTNNPEKLDPALITRFNYIFNFQEVNYQKALPRIREILQNEGVSYNDEELQSFLKSYIKRGLRSIYNILEVLSSNKILKFDNLNTAEGVSDSSNELYIVKTIKYLLYYVDTIPKDTLKNITIDVAKDEHFGTYYNYLSKIIKEDLLLNYDFIFKELINDESIDFSSRNILIKSYQDIDLKKFKSLHLLSTLHEAVLDKHNRRTLME